MRQRNGKLFEASFEKLAATLYRDHGLLLKKTDPPIRAFKRGGVTKIIFLRNSFLDFVGCWAGQWGRMVQIELKRTQESRLPVGGSSGLTEGQIEALKLWEGRGAVCCVLWLHDGRVGLFTLGSILAVLRERKHLRPSDAAESVPWPCKAEEFALAFDRLFA